MVRIPNKINGASIAHKFVIPTRVAHLSVDQRNANGIVTDQCAKPLPDVAELDKEGLHYMIAGNQGLFPRPVDDVGRPDERHPILGHARLLVHHLEDLHLRFHHQA